VQRKHTLTSYQRRGLDSHSFVSRKLHDTCEEETKNMAGIVSYPLAAISSSLFFAVFLHHLPLIVLQRIQGILLQPQNVRHPARPIVSLIEQTTNSDNDALLRVGNRHLLFSPTL
jgi:hypothetical protein